MNPRTHHLAIDGYVDAIPAAGTSWGTAVFDLIHSPADADTAAPDAPDTVYACTTGDLLRFTGTVVHPDHPRAPARFTVDALEVLEAAPVLQFHDLVLERYGTYVVVLDADRDAVPVFTISGQWVGLAEHPDAIGTLIDTFENDTSR
ncbi:hypothetical protein ABZ714_26495 [Streptomyces sp. NPDC006798]|uniref:hypothetical protein n=1 Tax=Streptomyces sp. NPDC006798 TaxID=3155462 RepID=UPI0033EFC578